MSVREYDRWYYAWQLDARFEIGNEGMPKVGVT